MSTKHNYPQEFKAYVVQFLHDNKIPATAVTMESSKIRTRINLEQVDEKYREAVAHFWDSTHPFWKEEGNQQYKVTAKIHLPCKYQNVILWKKNIPAKLSESDQKAARVISNAAAIPTAETFEEKTLRLDRENLLYRYEAIVYKAQQLFQKAEETLESNPEVSTEVELKQLLE